MQVSKAIEMLQKYYKPEDEIVITWWDKENVETYHLDRPIGDDEWIALVESYENDEDPVSEAFSNAINWVADGLDWEN
jgi:hypothetical protein